MLIWQNVPTENSLVRADFGRYRILKWWNL